MKLNWVRFAWDLAGLPAASLALPEHYRIDAAAPEDAAEMRQVVSRSLRLDPVWNPALHEVLQTVDLWFDHALVAETTNICLALRHGARIIGAAILSPEAAALHHLAPGPCILNEYRNRGFGSHLLEHSLRALRDAGLDQAAAITRELTPAARFLYPKFHGAASLVERVPLLAA